MKEHAPMRLTPTYAGPDSKGIVSVLGWDLEGMVAFYLVAGGVVGMALVFALARSSVWVRLQVGLLPVAASVIWIRVFVQGRPPSYQSDVAERWWRGLHFRLSPRRWRRSRHPRVLLEARRWEQEARHG